MSHGDLAGRARVDAHAPAAFGVCDYCGTWYNLTSLRSQTEFYGDSIQDKGYLACYRCLSQPQPQLSTPILPEDPIPVLNPRPEYYSTPADAAVNPAAAQLINANINTGGFTQIIGPRGTSLTIPLVAELDPTQPFRTKTELLASAATGWGLPQPTLTDRGGTIANSGIGQQIMAANPNRTYLLIYSPFTGLLAIAQNGTPTLGIPASYWGNPYTAAPTPAEVGTINVGVGQALLQNGGIVAPPQVWTGSVWAIGLIKGQPYWAWEG
jgi:hypothetical protein